MKKIIFILALFVSFVVNAQKTTGSNYTYFNTRSEWFTGIFQALGLPSGPGPAAFKAGQDMRAGALYYDSVGVDSGLHVWTGAYWRNYATASYTDADARAAISLTTTGTSGAATYDNGTGVFNIPNYQGGISEVIAGYGLLNVNDSTLDVDSLVIANRDWVMDRIAEVSSGSYTFSTGLTNTAGTITNNLSTGVSGGQHAYGGTAASDTLFLNSTTHATKGYVVSNDNMLVRKTTGAAYTSYNKVSSPGNVQVDFGMLGGPEANVSFNMHYQTDGLHRPYDTLYNSVWAQYGSGGWGVQFANAGNHSGGDVWDATGKQKLFFQSPTGKAWWNLPFSSYDGFTFTATHTIPRESGTASIAGWDDLVLSGHRTFASAGDIYLNSGGSGEVFIASGGGDTYISPNGGIVYGESDSNGDMTINSTSHATKTSAYLRLQSDGGNVGIGTTTPNGLLTVQSQVGANPSMQFNDADVTLPNYSAVGFSPTLATGTTLNLGPVSSTTGGVYINTFSSNSSTQPLIFDANAGATTVSVPVINFRAFKWNGSTNRTSLAATETVAQFSNATTPVMVLMGGGNVGIGTTAPDGVFEANLGTAGSFRLSYNDANGSAANRMDVTLSSTGNTTFNATGTNPEFIFSDNIQAPAPTYSSGGYSGLVRNTASGRFETVSTSALKPTLTKNATIENPTASENMGWFRTPVAITITNTHAVLVGTGTPSVTYQISFGTDITSLTNVYTAGQTVTSTTTGDAASGVNDATIPANSWVRIITSASTTTTQISLSITYTED